MTADRQVILGNHMGEKVLRVIGGVQDSYTGEIRAFVEFLEESRTPFTVTGVRKWIDHLKGKLAAGQIGPRTYNKRVAAIKRRLRWLFEQDENLSFDPQAMRHFKAFLEETKLLKISSSEVRVSADKMATPAEVETLRQSANPNMSLIIEFLAATGMRIFEAVGIPLRSCRVCDDHVEIVVVGKREKVRRNTIERDLYDRILELFKGSTYLFESPKGPDGPAHYHKNAVTSYVCKLSKKVLGRTFGPHAFRHGFVTEALRKGIPVQQVSDWVGHSSIDTTNRLYNHGSTDWTLFRGLMRQE